MLLAAIATLLGAFVQSATGFGFALVVSPALFAVMSPGEAVTTLVILSLVLNGLVLFAEGREREVMSSAVRPVLIAAAPGVVLGVLILDALSKSALQVGVGAAVIIAAAVQARLGARGGPAARWRSSPPAGEAYPVGLLTGVLTTSTAVSGPPLLLWLRARGATPAQLRDSLAAAFLGLNILGGVALAIVGSHFDSIEPAWVALLLGATLAGQLAGRLAFERLNEERFGRAVLVLAAAAGLASLAAGLT